MDASITALIQSVAKYVDADRDALIAYINLALDREAKDEFGQPVGNKAPEATTVDTAVYDFMPSAWTLLFQAAVPRVTLDFKADPVAWVRALETEIGKLAN